VKLPSAAGRHFRRAGDQRRARFARHTVVAEFVAARRGLGYTIQASSVDFNVAMMFACVVILSMIGVASSQADQARPPARRLLGAALGHVDAPPVS